MGIAAEGDSLSAVFRQAALGARQIVTESRDIRPQLELSLELTAADNEELLVSWLSELVYLLESQRFLLADCRVELFAGGRLRAQLWGESADPARHLLQREIKAVTYHQVRVEQVGDGWRAQVFVDL